MGGMCGIRGAAAVHAQSFKQREGCETREGPGLLISTTTASVRADFLVWLVGSSREPFCTYLLHCTRYPSLSLVLPLRRRVIDFF